MNSRRGKFCVICIAEELAEFDAFFHPILQKNEEILHYCRICQNLCGSYKLKKDNTELAADHGCTWQKYKGSR